MNKVVLLAINAKYIHSSLAVRFLEAGILQYAHRRYDVAVIETTTKQDIDAVVRSISELVPCVVGVSAYIWNAAQLPDLLKLLRERVPEAVIVLGGPEASHNPEYWLRGGADYIIAGEGERSFPAFLDALSENDVRALEVIPGLWRLHRGALCGNPEGEAAAELPNPYGQSYFNALGGRISYIETSRGCPFQCKFCLSGGSGVRFFPLETAKEQLYKLSKSGSRTIKFVDRTFNCNAKRAYDLFSYIISLDTSCCFHFEIGADLFDEDTLALLKNAPPGRIQLEAGLQSFYPPALEAVSRYMDIVKAEKNIRLLLEGGNIHLHLDLIAGLPYETLSDFRDSFNRGFALGAHTLQLGFLKLLHGSRLRREADTLGIIYENSPPYEIISNPWLSAPDIEILKNAENAIQHTYNKGRFLEAFRYVFSASGISPFDFFYGLGKRAPNHGTLLEVYAGQIYDYCVGLPNVDGITLRDSMICDWLTAVRGKNMPEFLKIRNNRRKLAVSAAEKLLGRVIDYDETAVLSSNRGAFIDSGARDPVTGLYRLYFLDLCC